MEKLKFGALIEKSIARTKQMLLKPFSFRKWMWLLFIAYMAGAMSGGTNLNYNFSGNNSSDQTQTVSESEDIAKDPDQAEPNDEPESKQATETDIFIRFVADKDFKAKEFFAELKKKAVSEEFRHFLLPIAIGVFVLFGIIIIFTWLYSRFLFIWFEAIVKDQTAIKEPFKRYKQQGSSIFKVSILMMFFGLILFGLIVLWMLSILRSTGVCADFNNLNFKEVLKVLQVPLITLLGWFIFSNLWDFFLSKFIVVFMAVKQTTFWPGFRELIRVLSEHKKDMFFFILMSILLGIAVWIIYIVVFLAGILISLLIGGVCLGLIYFIIVFLLKLKVLFNVLAIIFAVCFAVCVVLFITCIGLPFAVFFKNFLLYFISNLNCGYTPIPLIEEPDEAKPENKEAI
ncbi:MAG: hypothetical protein V1747_07745 [Candidatus Omnitrophota bacterium]